MCVHINYVLRNDLFSADWKKKNMYRHGLCVGRGYLSPLATLNVYGHWALPLCFVIIISLPTSVPRTFLLCDWNRYLHARSPKSLGCREREKTRWQSLFFVVRLFCVNRYCVKYDGRDHIGIRTTVSETKYSIFYLLKPFIITINISGLTVTHLKSLATLLYPPFKVWSYCFRAVPGRPR